MATLTASQPTQSMNHWLTLTMTLTGLGILSHLITLHLTPNANYAAMIWPNMGIYLGASLLYGTGALFSAIPAILINAVISYQFFNDSGLISAPVWLPLLLAGTSTLQLTLNYVLITRYSGYPEYLDSARTLIKIFAFSSITSLFNSAIAHISLAEYSQNNFSFWLQTGLTYWIGECLGLLIFTPLIFIWGQSIHRYNKQQIILLSSLLLGLYSGLLFSLKLATKLDGKEQAQQFQASSQLAISKIEDEFVDYSAFATQTTRLFYSNPQVDRDTFAIFVGDWLAHHPEIQAIEWAPRINDKERPAIEQQLSTWKDTPTSIFERDLNGAFITTAPALEYFPLLYAEPLTPNKMVLGLNIISTPITRTAQTLSARYGISIMTSPTKIMQDRHSHTAVISYLPVYQHLNSEKTWENLRGFIVLVLKTEAVFAKLSEMHLVDGQQLLVTDASTGTILYGQAISSQQMQWFDRLGLHYSNANTIHGQQWLFEVHPSLQQLGFNASRLTWLILFLSLIATNIIVPCLLLNAKRHVKLQRALEEQLSGFNQQQQQLQQEKDYAEQANISKGQFLAHMSHEIRTPMNAIIGYSHLLQESEISGKQREYVEKINYASQFLLNLINDILDLSKIEADKLNLDSTRFNLDEVLHRTTQQVVHMAAEKNLDFILDLAPDVPTYIEGDPVRLGQVLLNLCHNAIKFTHHGSVTVRVSTLSQNEHEARLRFQVQDTGVGISPEQLSQLFTAFYQGEHSNNRQYGGTGLGLAISKRLINLMGSNIEVQSSLKQGTTFCFSLSFPLAEQDTHDKADTQFHNLRALVVDDSPLVCDVLISMLKRLGIDAIAVNSGSSALALLREQSTHKGFDIVLIDWKMPEMDGVMTARYIRNDIQQGKQPYLILITAYERQTPQELNENALFSAYLHKPITPFMLQTTLQRVFRQPLTTTAPTASTSFAAARILLVEDNYINQRVATEMLRKLGLTVAIAADGQEALNRIAQDKEGFKLVLMDLQMPVMDGFVATARLREQYNATQLPIIAMTAHVLNHSEQRCIEAGMNAFIAKPIVMTQLINVLMRFLAPATKATPPLMVEHAHHTTRLNNHDLQMALDDLCHLLQRNSFDARMKFTELQATLYDQQPQLTEAIALALAKLDFKTALFLINQWRQVSTHQE